MGGEWEKVRSNVENMATNIAAPLTLRDSIPYEIWKKDILIWPRFTTVKPEKQALGIFLSIERKDGAAIVDINL